MARVAFNPKYNKSEENKIERKQSSAVIHFTPETEKVNYINGYSIFPHYKKLTEQYEDTQKRVDKLLKQGYKLVCLPEETSLWINGNEMRIIGQKPAEIFDGKNKKIIQPIEELSFK